MLSIVYHYRTQPSSVDCVRHIATISFLCYALSQKGLICSMANNSNVKNDTQRRIEISSRMGNATKPIQIDGIANIKQEGGKKEGS